MFSKISILPLSLIVLGGTAARIGEHLRRGSMDHDIQAGSNLIPQDTFSSQITGNAVDLGSVDHRWPGYPRPRRSIIFSSTMHSGRSLVRHRDRLHGAVEPGALRAPELLADAGPHGTIGQITRPRSTRRR